MPSARWAAWFIFIIAGCNQTSSKPAPPALAEKPRAESDLAFTTLSKKAYLALQIKTAEIAIQDVQERLTLTGWIMARPGNEVTLTAPTAGYVQFAKDKAAPVAGDRVKAGQELLQIKPVLSPVEQIQVAALKRGIESDLVKAQTTLKAAESDFSRIRDLHAQNLRTKQEFELAQKAHDHAVEELAAAKDKLKLFDLPAVSIQAPQAGVVLAAAVGPGQYVAASAPLVTIIDLQPIWVRVPVAEVDLPRIDRTQNISISAHHASGKAKDLFWSARPTGRVSQVDPLKHTAELWYEIEASKDVDRFVKDQMVSVQMPLGTNAKGIVAPYSAIIFDAHGHAWIYLERTTDKDSQHRFERRPVEMIASSDGGVQIRGSLTQGDRIVTNGAAVLFSRDFHKTPIAEED